MNEWAWVVAVLATTAGLMVVAAWFGSWLWKCIERRDKRRDERKRQQRETEAWEAAKVKRPTNLPVGGIGTKPIKGTITLVRDRETGLITQAVVQNARLTQGEATLIRAKVAEMMASPTPVIVIDGSAWEVVVK